MDRQTDRPVMTASTAATAAPDAQRHAERVPWLMSDQEEGRKEKKGDKRSGDNKMKIRKPYMYH